MESLDGLLRRATVEIILDRAAREPGVDFESRVEVAEESFSAVHKVLPAIFAIEDDGDEPCVMGQMIREMAEVREQMLGGLMRLVAPGHEAHEIAERLFAEDGIDGGAFVLDAPALKELEMVQVLAIAAERIEEVFLVRAEIFDARLAHERNELGGDAAFARPQSARCPAKHSLVLLGREPELCERILRPMKTQGPAASRHAAFGELRIVNERKNRVKERCRRELGLPARLSRCVERGDAREDLHVDVEDAVFFRLGEVAPFELQRRDFRIQLLGGEAAPSEIVPRLQIAEIGIAPVGEFGGRFIAVEAGATLCEELVVSGERPHQVVVMDFEEVLQNREALVLVEFRGGFARPLQPQIADGALHEFLDLQHQDGGKIEIHVDARELPENTDHIEITLHCVKPDPRHHRQPRRGIHVIRLVHVPNENNICHRSSLRGQAARRKQEVVSTDGAAWFSCQNDERTNRTLPRFQEPQRAHRGTHGV